MRGDGSCGRRGAARVCRALVHQVTLEQLRVLWQLGGAQRASAVAGLVEGRRVSEGLRLLALVGEVFGLGFLSLQFPLEVSYLLFEGIDGAL